MLLCACTITICMLLQMLQTEQWQMRRDAVTIHVCKCNDWIARVGMDFEALHVHDYAQVFIPVPMEKHDMHVAEHA